MPQKNQELLNMQNLGEKLKVHPMKMTKKIQQII